MGIFPNSSSWNRPPSPFISTLSSNALLFGEWDRISKSRSPFPMATGIVAILNVRRLQSTVISTERLFTDKIATIHRQNHQKIPQLLPTSVQFRHKYIFRFSIFLFFVLISWLSSTSCWVDAICSDAYFVVLSSWQDICVTIYVCVCVWHWL